MSTISPTVALETNRARKKKINLQYIRQINRKEHDRETRTNLNEATNELIFRVRFSLHNQPEKQFAGVTQIVGETISLDAA